jgi:ribonuclease HII
MKPVAVVCGPVTAAAVILPADFKNTILNDSKQLSEKAREITSHYRQQAITFVTHLEPLEIDSINILNASIKAMQECVLKLTPTRIYHSGWKQPFYSKKGYKTVVVESLLQQK